MANDFDIEIYDGKKYLRKYRGNEESVNIPGSVTVIGARAFLSYKNLTSVVIHEGVKVIGQSAFYDCSSLTTALIPSSITEIGDVAFACCTNLSSVIMPKGLKKIGLEAFRGCQRLEIGIYYHHVYSLKPNNIGGLSANISPVDFYNKTINLLDDESRKVGKLFILDFIRYQPDRDFASRLMRGMVNNLSEYDALFVSSYKPVIGKVKAAIYRLEYPLELDEDYKKLYIAYLKKNAHLVIPVLIKVGDVKSINVLASIGAIAASNISSYIDIANKNSQTEILAVLLDYQNKTMGQHSIPVLVLDQNKSANEWCTQENEDGTFTITKYLGKSLDVKIPAILNGKKVSSIEGSIGSLKVSIFFQHNNSVQSTVIEKGIEEIGEYAFLECRNLKSIVIPESVKEIGKEAFSGCINLSSVVIPKGVDVISEETFTNCTRLCSVDISEGVNTLENGVFFICISLTNINLPGTVSKIGNYCFCGCTNLASINIPLEVTSIGRDAFVNCPNLVIHSPEGSYAIKYAKKNGIKYLEM
jgi:hypothetical protein